MYPVLDLLRLGLNYLSAGITGMFDQAWSLIDLLLSNLRRKHLTEQLK